MRLNRVLAHAGYGSRRAAEEVILQGRVTVNGEVVRELGVRLDPDVTKVTVDGEPIALERPVYIVVNKPKGYVSTNDDPAGRPRVVDLLPELPERVYTVGRLDEESTGLLLLTNDGELANRLAHPRFGVEKVYRALVAGHPEPVVLDRLMEGVWLSDGKARARHARFAGKQGDATMIELILGEGKNREVRRMLAKLGHKVMSLTRISVGPIGLRGLAIGAWRHLTSPEVDLLRRVADGEPVATPGGERRTARKPRPQGGLSNLVEPAGVGAGRGPRPARPERAAPRGRTGPAPDGLTPVGGRKVGNHLLGPAPSGTPNGGRPAGPRPDVPLGPRPVGGGGRKVGGHDLGPPAERRPGGRPPVGRPSARPGLYEPRAARREDRAEVEPTEVLVSPVGDDRMAAPAGARRAAGLGPRRPLRSREPVEGAMRVVDGRRILGLESTEVKSEEGPIGGPGGRRPSVIRRVKPLKKPRRRPTGGE